METGKMSEDILELFFSALERPQPTIVTELLSGNGKAGLTSDPK